NAEMTSESGPDLSLPSRKKYWWNLEDWVAVWIGITSLIVILAGYRPAARSLKWESLGDGLKILSLESILGWAGVAVVVWLISSIGILLMKDSVPRYTPAYLVIFLLA